MENINRVVMCSKCGAWTSDSEEVYLMEIGELDNRCPCCEAIGTLALSEKVE